LSLFIERYATPLTTGLFAVSAISGIALFFHWSQGTFHEMHEWLSMVLLVPFGLHLWKNWRMLLGYLRRGVLPLALAAALVVAMPFALSGAAGRGPGRAGNPAARVVRLLTQLPLSQLAVVLKTDPDILLGNLRQQGYTIASASDTLEMVAASSGREAPELMYTLLNLSPSAPRASSSTTTHH
jgi:hypothetical protein